MAFAQINGQKIHYTDHGGDGPVVVFSHGFLMDETMFAPQVAALRDHYRVITWDERGFGQTESDGQPFSYWDSASDVLGLLDHLGVERAVLGGMSQGGFLSLRATLTAPERVRGLILLDTSSVAEHPEVAAGYRQMIDTWAAVGAVDELAGIIATIIIDDEVENQVWIAKWKARPKEHIIEPGNCLLSRDDITDRLGEITCPALVVHGTSDTAITMDKAETMAAGLVGCGGVVAVPGAHAANLTHPEAVNSAIIEFLAGLPA